MSAGLYRVNNLLHRKLLRLREYDYSQPNAYFITTVCHKREELLIIDKVIEVVEKSWNSLANRYKHVLLDEYVIMPNHFHGIVMLIDARESYRISPEDSDDARKCGGASAATTKSENVSDLIRVFKSISAIEANRILKRSGMPFWQRSFHDHIIGNECDLLKCRKYIINNPANWASDKENPRLSSTQRHQL